MKRSRYISLLLVAVMLVTAIAIPNQVNAAELNLSSVHRGQQYFARLLGSYARADYYENGILASVTVSQGIYESGWGRSSLAVGGNNLFGIKAYSTWSGKVYDEDMHKLYASYEDYRLANGQMYADENDAWRAHSDWQESVIIHSRLLRTYDGVAGEGNYRTAYEKIVAGGYCNDNGYIDTACGIIELYGLTYYDDLSADSDGVIAITSTKDRLFLGAGQTYNLSYEVKPADKTPSVVTWASDMPSVATVDQNGTVTAVSHGMTLITATLANGREACCIVYVDCNATVIDKDINVYASADDTSENLGKIYRGNSLKVADTTIYTDANGNRYYKVSGYDRNEKLVSGYAYSKYIYVKNPRYITSLSVPKTDLTLKAGTTYAVDVVSAPVDVTIGTIAWKSSDPSVASVDQNGVITALKAGTAVVSVYTLGAIKNINVTVAAESKEYKALVTAYSKVTVRTSPTTDSASLGSAAYLSQVTVHGEPEGFWYKVTAATTSNKTVTGYIYHPYLHLVPDGKTVTESTSVSGTYVYSSTDAAKQVGTLANGYKMAVIGETTSDGWSYVIGLNSSSDVIYGYAKLGEIGDVSGGNNGGTTGGDNSGGGTTVLPDTYYAFITAETLTVRPEPTTSLTGLGTLVYGTVVTVTGDAVSSGGRDWYAVSGVCTSGAQISGYSWAQYIEFLYDGKVTGVNADSYLTVRDAPSGDKIGQLKPDQEVTVIGEASDGWYMIMYTDSEGNEVLGYSSADFLTVSGKKAVTVSGGDTSGGNTSGGNSSGGNTSGGNTSGGNGSEDIPSVTPPVTPPEENAYYGDANEDNKVNISDCVLIKRRILGTYSFTEEQTLRSDINEDGKINISDYILCKRIILKTYSK